MIPQWDLNIGLEKRCVFPFEPLPSDDIKWLSLKTTFLTVIRASPYQRTDLLIGLWRLLQALMSLPRKSCLIQQDVTQRAQ